MAVRTRSSSRGAFGVSVAGDILHETDRGSAAAEHAFAGIVSSDRFRGWHDSFLLPTIADPVITNNDEKASHTPASGLSQFGQFHNEPAETRHPKAPRVSGLVERGSRRAFLQRESSTSVSAWTWAP